MESRLVNVRLDEKRVRKVETLRKRGVSLSAVVREAIDARFAALDRPDSPRDATAIVGRIFDRYPDPPGQPRRRYDVHDRRAARAAVVRNLRRAR